jgi:hypothetical protein
MQTHLFKIKGIAIILFFSFIFIGCKEDTADDNENIGDTNEIEKYMEGNLIYGDINQEINGILTISDELLEIETIIGNLLGVVTVTEIGYDITISSANGSLNVFSNSLNGTYNTSNNSLSLTGTSLNGQSLFISGNVQTIEEANQAFYDSHAYTGIYFTHDESCNVTISVAGESLGPVQRYYHEGGMCATDWYRESGFVHLDYEGANSELITASGVVEGLNGGYVPYEHNYAALFVLPKNQEYTYYAEWDNGEMTSGTFTTPNGGLSKAVCISNNGVECDYSDPEETGITINTLEIDSQINYSPYDAFYFDESIFLIKYDRTRLQIGNSSSPYLIINVEFGEIQNTTIYFDTEENYSLTINMGGSAFFNHDFTVYDFIHDTDTKGSMQISNLDYDSGTATLNFNNVLVNMSTNYGSQYFRFSGTLSGIFLEE